MRLLVGLILNLQMGQLEQKIEKLPFLLIGIVRHLNERTFGGTGNANGMQIYHCKVIPSPISMELGK